MLLRFKTLLFLALAPAAAILTGCGTEESISPLLDFSSTTAVPTWAQWGQTAQHQGNAAKAGQSLGHILASTVFDPLALLEKQDGGGDILLHYQTPLLDGDDVFMEHKSGRFVPCGASSSEGGPTPMGPCGAATWNQETWGEKRFTWEGGKLVEKWSVASDWTPEIQPVTSYGWEPVFHGALAGPYVVLPARGGTVLVVDRESGLVLRRINPFDTIEDDTYVASPLTVDAQGNIYYNALALGAGKDPWNVDDVRGAWLVKIDHHGVPSKVSFQTLAPDAPDAKAMCRFHFHNNELPWPPSPDAVPFSGACGSQRAGLNIAPAVAPDGTIYTASRAHFASGYSYLLAVNPDLTPKWASSLRSHLADGCGTPTLPPNGQPGGCKLGAHTGVDPRSNEDPPGRIDDSSSASPVVAPDGSVYFGVLTTYNYDRGHLFHFSEAGTFLDSYDFGWDVTPAIFPHDGTYSVVIKDNHYGVGSYCVFDQFCPPKEEGPFDITQLSPSLVPEWKFTSVNQKSCVRGADGNVTCMADHPTGFEWCINAPAVDPDGTVYANSEDGALYSIPQGGKSAKSIFLGESVGAAYTPLSIDAKGRIYAENLGTLFVVGD